MPWRLGTIGFGYSDWQGTFYPNDVKASEHLAFYARHFDTLELDTTFHAAPTVERVRRWAAAVPDDFRFCVKTPKDVTHGDGPLTRRTGVMLDFVDTLRAFAAKLGPVLLQFPPSFDAGGARELAGFLSKLPGDVRYAVELRHASWNTPRTAELLRDHECCRVAADYLDEPWDVPPTTDFLYVRWIGVHGKYPTLDRERLDLTARLEWWKHQLVGPAKTMTVYGLVNNDYSGYAVATCNRMKRLVGLPVVASTDARQGELFGPGPGS